MDGETDERVISSNTSDRDSSSDAEESEKNESEAAVANRHPVWRSFEIFKKKTNEGMKRQAKCLLKTGKGKLCGQILQGWYPTNAKKHIRTKHTKEYTTLKDQWTKERSSAAKKKGNGSTSVVQQKLFFGGVPAKYQSQHPKQRNITEKWAMAFTANHLPTSLIENREFRDALLAMEEKYSVPSAYLLSKESHRLFNMMKKRIMDQLSNARKVAITVDIWTKRGMSESFLGITAHWFDPKSHQRKMAALTVRNLFGSHTADAIRAKLEEVLKEWNIPGDKVSKVVTDNGSNMVAAFQKAHHLVVKQDIATEKLVAKVDAAEADWRLQSSFTESDSNELEILNEGDDDDFDSMDAEIEQEVKEFDDNELEMGRGLGSLQRLSCFAHSLQCSVRTVDTSKFTMPSRRQAFKLMQHFSHSTKATQLLLEKTRKKLLTSCKTRWSYTLLALRRLLELKTAVSEVTTTLDSIDNLTNSEWKDIERYAEFMKPFADITYSIEGDQYTTLSQVIPCLIELEEHLKQMGTKQGFVAASEQLLTEIRRRFAHIMEAHHSNFEPVYAVATLLDPRFQLLLNNDGLQQQNDPRLQLLFYSAKNEILRLLGTSTGNEAVALDLERNVLAREEAAGPFKFVAAMIRKQQQSQDIVMQEPTAVEVARYLDSKHSISFNEEPLTFWREKNEKYPKLAVLAQEIMVIPATSAPVERLFSQASIATGGKRNRLAGDRLQREVMMKANKHFF